jgi:Bacterial protein of unknown function (DUF977)
MGVAGSGPLAKWLRRLEKKVEREKIMPATLQELSLQIVEFAREHGRVTMADAVKLTEANRNTLKQHLRNLVARGHLQQHGSGRGVWSVASGGRSGQSSLRAFCSSPTGRLSGRSVRVSCLRSSLLHARRQFPTKNRLHKIRDTLFCPPVGFLSLCSLTHHQLTDIYKT